MAGKAKRYKNGLGYYAENPADENAELDKLHGYPDAILEFRRGTVELLLNHARRPEVSVAKVVSGAEPVFDRVYGYVTFLSCIEGADLAELEKRLGFRTGVLTSRGAHLYRVDPSALTSKNVAPRGNTDWSAGITPRDLDSLTKTVGETVEHHREFPAAEIPIIQFRIHWPPVPCLGAPRFLKDNDRV